METRQRTLDEQAQYAKYLATPQVLPSAPELKSKDDVAKLLFGAILVVPHIVAELVHFMRAKENRERWPDDVHARYEAAKAFMGERIQMTPELRDLKLPSLAMNEHVKRSVFSILRTTYTPSVTFPEERGREA